MSLNRRQFLTHTMHGFSGVALAAMLAEEARGELPKIDPAKPYKPRPTHFAPKAKRVIEVFCSGALSHVDTFDYKPELIRRHGQPLPGNEKLVSFQGPNGNLTQPLWTFRRWARKTLEILLFPRNRARPRVARDFGWG